MLDIQIVDKIHNENANIGERKITSPSSALGILRLELMKYIGIERLKSFLFHYGWEMGASEAQNKLKSETALEDLIRHGMRMHLNSGHITGTSFECSVKLDEKDDIASVYATGKWYGSHEAYQHIQFFGVGNEPVCHTLTGYTSGFMTSVTGRAIIAQEVECVGKGDKVCRWVVQAKEDWQSESAKLDFYNVVPIVRELELTYEQLLEQKQFVTRLSDFQYRLTEEIINGAQLQTIADMLFNTAQIPVMIEDRDLRTIAYSGLSEDAYMQLKSDFEDYMQRHTLLGNVTPGMHRKITCRTDMQQRLMAPIIIQKEVYGYCSFVYIDQEMEHLNEAFLFLDRFANAVSVYLLNQKTRFESFERIKGTFLEQILDNKLTKAEILSRAQYAEIDLDKPYFIAAMKYNQPDLEAKEQFQLQERLFETVVYYFNIKKQHKILVSQRDGRMILLLSAENINNDTVYGVFREFYLYLKSRFPKETFFFGISSCGYQIEQASKYYKEALVALSLPLKKTIAEFHKMGILGVLVNSDNREAILSVAKQELGPLFGDSDPKNLDLLKTLYTFLINGGKLEQTMKDLSLSMSGLRHRLQKIESVLNKDLRESTTAHQLWMLMNALIVIGELDMQ